jgi:hypothetical protein
MTNQDHTDILSAYLQRITLADLKLLNTTITASWSASLNYGMNEQIKRQNDVDNAIAHVIEGILWQDKALIDKVILQAVDKATA